MNELDGVESGERSGSVELVVRIKATSLVSVSLGLDCKVFVDLGKAFTEFFDVDGIQSRSTSTDGRLRSMRGMSEGLLDLPDLSVSRVESLALRTVIGLSILGDADPRWLGEEGTRGGRWFPESRIRSGFRLRFLGRRSYGDDGWLDGDDG